MSRLIVNFHSVDPEYRAARHKSDGERITGWIIRRHGEPAYFQIEGRKGLCVSIDAVTDIQPAS